MQDETGGPTLDTLTKASRAKGKEKLVHARAEQQVSLLLPPFNNMEILDMCKIGLLH